MTDLALAAAQSIVADVLRKARAESMMPLAVIVLDARGALKAAAVEDGSSLKRAEVAHGKAYGALALGSGSRTLAKRAREQAPFIAAASHVIDGPLIPAPGGVLIRDGGGRVIGAVGVSGDTSENDEAAALAAIASAGFTGDPGSD